MGTHVDPHFTWFGRTHPACHENWEYIRNGYSLKDIKMYKLERAGFGPPEI